MIKLLKILLGLILYIPFFIGILLFYFLDVSILLISRDMLYEPKHLERYIDFTNGIFDRISK